MSARRAPRVIVAIAMAMLLAFVASILTTSSRPAQGAGELSSSSKKVVIVVGPVGSTTSGWRREARALARIARSHGARVKELYSPYATWPRVRRAARNADLLIYFGHGNGWPSPYSPFQPYTKNGLGLNAAAGHGHHNVTYKGEYYVRQNLKLAPNAIVLLVHLCYASGNPEWGGPTPTLSTAKSRVDHYANGFLRAGAAAVVAQGLGRADYFVRGLFRSNKTIAGIFWSAPNAKGKHTVTFRPRRSPDGSRAVMDPARPGDYYRSAVGRLNLKASTWR